MISMTLLTRLLQHQFVEKLYPARVAGIGYASSLSDMGLVFHVGHTLKYSEYPFDDLIWNDFS